jgi:four helix bundle protein
MMKTIDEWILHTRLLAVRLMDMTDKIPYASANNEIIRQITRSANSVAANYRATKRAKSSADFLNKYRIVEEEADETIHFLEVIKLRLSNLAAECDNLIKKYPEFLSIVVSSINSIKKNNPTLK